MMMMPVPRTLRLHLALHPCPSSPPPAICRVPAALLQEKQQWLQKLRAAEAEAERCRTEAQALRLQLLHLLPSTGAGPAAAQQQEEQREQLVQQLLDGQAAEAAMREVLAEAREEQVAACKALAAELRRVHALERLRIGECKDGPVGGRPLHRGEQHVAAWLVRESSLAGAACCLLGLTVCPAPAPQVTWQSSSVCSAGCNTCSASASSWRWRWWQRSSSSNSSRVPARRGGPSRRRVPTFASLLSVLPPQRRACQCSHERPRPALAWL